MNMLQMFHKMHYPRCIDTVIVIDLNWHIILIISQKANQSLLLTLMIFA